MEAKPRLGSRRSVSGGKVTNSRAASIDNGLEKIGSRVNSGLKTIERKNKQLNQSTKQLEEKVKSLRQRTLPRVANTNNGGSKVKMPKYHAIEFILW